LHVLDGLLPLECVVRKLHGQVDHVGLGVHDVVVRHVQEVIIQRRDTDGVPGDKQWKNSRGVIDW